MTNKISIIVPCYNQSEFLDECLQSVLNQTYANWECLIINDGSTDNTEEIAQNWTIKDDRFNYFYKENGGLSSARNFGLERISGHYIQFLDSDDCLKNTKFELSVDAVSHNPLANIVISNFRMFENNLAVTMPPYCVLNHDKFTFENVVFQWDVSFTIPIHCGFFEKSLFNNFRFPENLTSKEDWVMWVNLFTKNPFPVFIDLPLAMYRRNPKSMTMTKNMLSDTLNAITLFKKILSEEDLQKLYEGTITKYYNATLDFKLKLINLKNADSFKLIYLTKKILTKLKLLKLGQSVINWVVNRRIFSNYFN